MSIENEGVVKYNLNFTPKDIAIDKEYELLEKCREELYSLGLIGAYDDGIGFGNISVRYENSDKFVITSTQTGHLENLTIDDYSLVDEIDFGSFKTIASGKSKPSSECITHGAIYGLDKNIDAVIHIHNLKLWEFMLENDYLSTNDTPYGTIEMVEDVKDIYKNIDSLQNNLLVMKGHYEGIVSFGKDIEDAKKPLFNLIRKVFL